MPPGDGFTSNADGFPAKPLHPGLNLVFAMGASRTQAVGASMKELAILLSNRVNRPVIDATHLSGKYDFILTSSITDGADQTFPGIFAALPKQLGLRLISQTVRVDRVVIDHIEKSPSEN
jgi:uncharacterized protein (TIGR03435 family)